MKIVRQSTGKGKLRFFIRWEDPTAPDSWSDSVDVNDERKRVFYLTHTKTGAKRVHPLEDTQNPTLTIIEELNEIIFYYIPIYHKKRRYMLNNALGQHKQITKTKTLYVT